MIFSLKKNRVTLIFFLTLFFPINSFSYQDGLNQALGKNNPQVVFIGETHGTKNTYQFLESFLKEANKPINLGLELSHSLQVSINHYLTSNDNSFKEYLRKNNVHYCYKDGRFTESTIDFIDFLKNKFSGENKLKVFTYSHSDAGDDSRLESMARVIDKNVSESGKSFLSIILSGNMHSRTQKGAFGQTDYRPVAYRLIQSGKRVTSILLTSTGGEAWLCREECKKTEVLSSLPRTERFKVIPSRYDYLKHDYEVNVGSLQVSYPTGCN